MRLSLLAGALAAAASAQPAADTALVRAHVAALANNTFRPPSGALPYPYLVPAGPYNEQWDWDSLFMGVALASYGGAPYFAGTFMNFLHFTNLSTGDLPGCLTPQGPSQTLYHAKPVIIQGALLAARQTGNFSAFLPHADAMRALLRYWNSSTRLHAPTGLHTWHDQLETGADNLVLSQCPSQFSPECWSAAQAYTLSSPDVMVWLAREYQAYALFLAAWGALGGAPGGAGAGLYARSAGAEAAGARAYAARLADVIQARLWRWLDAPANTRGMYVGYNVSTGAQSVHATYLAAWPLWAGLAASPAVAAAALARLQEADLWTPFGLRSVSSADPRYNNDDIINPYSNWRGPVWVNVGAVMAYTLRAQGQGAAAAALADALVHTLAQDLRATGTWHEAYSSANGSGLAAPGFLSWDTIAADLQGNVARGVDPFLLE